MTLPEWVLRKGRGAISELSRLSGIAYPNVVPYAHGKLVRRYDVAKRLSDATAGEVSIAELCESSPADVDTGVHHRAKLGKSKRRRAVARL